MPRLWPLSMLLLSACATTAPPPVVLPPRAPAQLPTAELDQPLPPAGAGRRCALEILRYGERSAPISALCSLLLAPYLTIPAPSPALARQPGGDRL